MNSFSSCLCSAEVVECGYMQVISVLKKNSLKFVDYKNDNFMRVNTTSTQCWTLTLDILARASRNSAGLVLAKTDSPRWLGNFFRNLHSVIHVQLILGA